MEVMISVYNQWYNNIVIWISCKATPSYPCIRVLWNEISTSDCLLTTDHPPSLDDDAAIKWKHFLHCWPFVRGNQWSPVDSIYKGQWRGDLMFSLICAWTIWLSKQSRCWLFEMPLYSLWYHCNVVFSGVHTNVHSFLKCNSNNGSSLYQNNDIEFLFFLFQKIDVTGKLVEELVARTHEVLQPNPGEWKTGLITQRGGGGREVEVEGGYWGKDTDLLVWEFLMWRGDHIDGLVQERRNSSALALELRLSCTNPSISRLSYDITWHPLLELQFWYPVM